MARICSRASRSSVRSCSTSLRASSSALVKQRPLPPQVVDEQLQLQHVGRPPRGKSQPATRPAQSQKIMNTGSGKVDMLH